MKNILLLSFIVIIFSGCKKYETPTSFQIVNNVAKYQSETEFLDGSMYDVVVYVYSAKTLLKTINISKINPNEGMSNIYEVKGADNIQVIFKSLPAGPVLHSGLLSFTSKWTLKIGTNNIIYYNTPYDTEH